MENILINPHNLIDFQLKLKQHTVPLPTTSSVVSSGSLNHQYSDEEDIEMFGLQSMSYTSLKDVMTSASPPSTPASCGSWKEIPIKDPLVQHAAWAYLQPMAEAGGEDDERRWGTWGRAWRCFNDVVLVVFKGLFGHELSDDDDMIMYYDHDHDHKRN